MQFKLYNSIQLDIKICYIVFRWKMESREMLARAEYRKLKLTNRIIEEDKRLKEDDESAR